MQKILSTCLTLQWNAQNEREREREREREIERETDRQTDIQTDRQRLCRDYDSVLKKSCLVY